MIVIVACLALLLAPSSEAIRSFDDDETAPPSAADPKPCTNQDKPSYLWRIEAAHLSNTSHLFGTVHLPYSEVWAHVPTNSKETFFASDIAVFELDGSDEEMQRTLKRCQELAPGMSIEDVIPASLYRRIVKHFDYVKRVIGGWLYDAKGADEKQRISEYVTDFYTNNEIEGSWFGWKRKKPEWLAIFIETLTEWSIRNRSVPWLDLYLTNLAKRNSKTVRTIETSQEQCDIINGMTAEQNIYALNDTLNMYEGIQRGEEANGTSLNKRLITKYNCLALDEDFIFPNQRGKLYAVSRNDSTVSRDNRTEEETPSLRMQVDRYFLDNVIVKRNMRMAERIDRMLTENPVDSHFFAFGLGHFLGDVSVQSELVKRGYKIYQVPASYSRRVLLPSRRQHSQRRRRAKKSSQLRRAKAARARKRRRKATALASQDRDEKSPNDYFILDDVSIGYKMSGAQHSSAATAEHAGWLAPLLMLVMLLSNAVL